MGQDANDLKIDLFNLLSGHFDEEMSDLMKESQWWPLARLITMQRPNIPNRPKIMSILRQLIISERRSPTDIISIRRGVKINENRATAHTGPMLGQDQGSKL